MAQKSVLFVCLGNICRSPLAEAALRAEAVAHGLALTIDSAGTSGLHSGEGADPRALAEAERHGLSLAEHRARQLVPEDFTRFSHIYVMDQNNLRDARALAPARSTARVALLLDVVPGRAGEAVIDPWYGGPEDFAATWDDVAQAARHIVAALNR